MAQPPDELQQQSGNAGIDAGGDPGDAAFLMNKKISRLAGNPTQLVDKDFQRLQRQAPRTRLQNVPTQTVSGLIMAAGRKGRKGRKF
jgi:hypothetical protein